MLNITNKRIAKNTLFLYIRMGVVMMITLYTSRIFLRTLGIDDFGIFNVVAGFVSMFTFLNSTMASSIQRFFNYEIGRNTADGVKKVYSSAILTQVVLAVIIIVLVESIGIWYLNNKMVIPNDRVIAANIVFHLSVISTLFVIITVPFTGAVLAYEKMDFYAIVGIIEVILKLGIAIILPCVGGDSLIIYAFLLMAVTILSFTLNFVYTKKYFSECKFDKNIDVKLLKEMIGFSGWHAFSAAGTMFGNQGINMILNLFYGPVVNAARGIAYQINSAIMSFVRNISVASKPQMIQSFAEGNTKRSLNITYTISKFSFIACLLFILPVCLEMDFILKVWLGADAVPENTRIFAIWVLLTSLICTLDTPITTLVHATGNIRNYHIVSTLITLIALPIGYFCLKVYDVPVLIFIVQFAAVIAGQVVGLFMLKKVFEFSILDYAQKVLWPILLVSCLSLIVPIVTFTLFDESFARFILIVIISLISVIVCTYYFALNSKEKGLITNSLFSKLRKS